MQRRIAVVAGISLLAAGATFSEGHTLKEKYVGLKAAAKQQHAGHAVKDARVKQPEKARNYAAAVTRLRHLLRSLAPAQTSSSTSVSSGYSGGGNWAIPESIVQCESGGNYSAVNPSSGARGAYQLMPQTYYSNGGDGSWSPDDQDRVAARVWAGGAGRGNWVC